MYWPDQWVLLELVLPAETLYKVFGSWYGGYTGGDSWRMNSGIESVERDEEHGLVLFHGYSGSTYACPVDAYGAHTYGHGVLKSMLEQQAVPVRVLTEEEATAWIRLSGS